MRRRKPIQLMAERLPDGNLRAAPLRLTSTGTADAWRTSVKMVSGPGNPAPAS